MSLARVWRRQLVGGSSAALMVPAAMLAAVVALALNGGFSQVGVLGQIFAGPPAPSPTRPPGRPRPSHPRLRSPSRSPSRRRSTRWSRWSRR